MQHLAMFDQVAVSGSLTDRIIEHVRPRQEHFVNPASVCTLSM
jgi:L-fuconate dehydratase